MTWTSDKAATRRAMFRERDAAGLCRDCGEPRGDDGTTHRCRACADAVAAGKRQQRALRLIREAFDILSAETQANRPARPSVLRLVRRGRERAFRVEGTDRVVTHGDLLVALLSDLGVRAKRPRRRR